MATDSLVNSNGNNFLDILGQATSIVSSGADSLFTSGGTFLDRLTAYQISKKQTTSKTVTTNNVTNATDNDKLRMIALYSIGALAAVGLTIYLVRK